MCELYFYLLTVTRVVYRMKSGHLLITLLGYEGALVHVHSFVCLFSVGCHKLSPAKHQLQGARYVFQIPHITECSVVTYIPLIYCLEYFKIGRILPLCIQAMFPESRE